MSSFGHQLEEMCINFSIRVINLYKYLTSEKKEFVLSKQLLRSGTSIGANLVEAQNAISKKEFLSKSYISFKEAAESGYWIELLYRTEYITKEQYTSLKMDCNELIKIFSSITKSTKESL